MSAAGIRETVFQLSTLLSVSQNVPNVPKMSPIQWGQIFSVDGSAKPQVDIYI
jgi:hypothetical protein